MDQKVQCLMRLYLVRYISLKSRVSRLHLLRSSTEMASNDTSTPDLATILATLAGLAPPKPPGHQTESSQQIHPIPHSQQFHQPLPYVTQQPPQQWPQSAPIYPVPRSSTPADTHKVRLIDPATIVDWSSGLKCVMRTVAKQESILHDIRRVSAPSSPLID